MKYRYDAFISYRHTELDQFAAENLHRQIEAQAVSLEAQAAEIEAQNDALLENQARSLAAEALRLLERGDRIRAIETAVSAMTEYEGMRLPCTP